MENPPPKELTAIRYSQSKKGWRCTSGGTDECRTPFPSAIVLISWNVNKATPFRYERLGFILSYIKLALEKCRVEPSGSAMEGEQRPPPPCCILLQEVHREAFAALLEDTWVRDYFQIVPGSVQDWPARAGYGNVTIVARSIPMSNARVVEFGDTTMGRNAVMVDLHLNAATRPERGKGKERVVDVMVRVANAHLESRMEGFISRMNQMRVIAEELRDNTIDGGVVGGTMNAVRHEDQGLPVMFGLADAWTKGDLDEEGFTWGYQPAKSKRQPGRLDKVLYWQYRDRFRLGEPRILGIGLRFSPREFASDHYGLLSVLRMS